MNESALVMQLMHQEGMWKTERNVQENVKVWKKKSDSMGQAKGFEDVKTLA